MIISKTIIIISCIILFASCKHNTTRISSATKKQTSIEKSRTLSLGEAISPPVAFTDEEVKELRELCVEIKSDTAYLSAYNYKDTSSFEQGISLKEHNNILNKFFRSSGPDSFIIQNDFYPRAICRFRIDSGNEAFILRYGGINCDICQINLYVLNLKSKFFTDTFAISEDNGDGGFIWYYESWIIKKEKSAPVIIKRTKESYCDFPGMGFNVKNWIKDYERTGKIPPGGTPMNPSCPIYVGENLQYFNFNGGKYVLNKKIKPNWNKFHLKQEARKY